MIETENGFWMVWVIFNRVGMVAEFRDGKFAAVAIFPDPAEGRAA